MLGRWALAIAVCLSAALASVAQERTGEGGSTGPTKKRNGPTVRSEDAIQKAVQKQIAEEEKALQRKAELLTFAEQNLPQLRSLLDTLEAKRPEQFRTALLNLARDEKRLSGLEKLDPERFELELKRWTTDQRIQIVTARLALQGESDGIRSEMKELLATRNELRLQWLQLDLERSRERVVRLEGLIQEAIRPSDAELQRQLDQLIARTKREAQAKTTPPENKADRELKKHTRR
jgi:hypothetical protein